MSGLLERADYGQFLLVSHLNYTLTYFAEHSETFSHDAATGYLERDRIRPETLGQRAKRASVVSANGYLLFDNYLKQQLRSPSLKFL